MEGTGSILQMGNFDESDRETLLEQGQLRFFSPREVANLLCFPKSLDFPKETTNRQLYKCLGNSLNCCVSSFIIKVALKLQQSET